MWEPAARKRSSYSTSSRSSRSVKASSYCNRRQYQFLQSASTIICCRTPVRHFAIFRSFPSRLSSSITYAIKPWLMILLHMHWKSLVSNWKLLHTAELVLKMIEYHILVFVENTKSFAFLYDESHWPSTVAERTYTKKIPSSHLQLSLSCFCLTWNRSGRICKLEKEYMRIIYYFCELYSSRSEKLIILH